MEFEYNSSMIGVLLVYFAVMLLIAGLVSYFYRDKK